MSESDKPEQDISWPELGAGAFVHSFDQAKRRFYVSIPVGGDWEQLKLFVSGQALCALRSAYLQVAAQERAAMEQQQRIEAQERARINGENAKSGMRAFADRIMRR